MVELKQELVTMKACFLVTGFVVAFATNQNFVHFSSQVASQSLQREFAPCDLEEARHKLEESSCKCRLGLKMELVAVQPWLLYWISASRFD